MASRMLGPCAPKAIVHPPARASRAPPAIVLQRPIALPATAAVRYRSSMSATPPSRSQPQPSAALRRASPPVEWAISPAPVDYLRAVALMESRAAAIARAGAPELVWLLEHPPLYTAGGSARPADLLAADRFPVYPTRRGGQYTYHGPGQRVAYLMLDVGARGRDVRAFVAALEHWVIGSLDRLGVVGETRDDRVGVWVRRHAPAREDKIAAIGVQLKSWVSLHGIALNVAPDLAHYAGIVPCGIAGHGVTSLSDLGRPASMETVDKALRGTFEAVFGATADAPCPLAGMCPLAGI